ncbi:MAG: LytTR family DNA-binding domain-containing protein [Saprospiraceae bacterium]
MTNKLHILVLEDEQSAGEKLIQMIRRQAPDATIDWLRTVQAGIDFLKSKQPDLLFSDIELLDGNAFQIYQSITPACPIIFCTAFDVFYVEAFQTNGIAYLLKPYSKEEFQVAWEKFKRLFQPQKPTSLDPKLLAKLATLVQQPIQNYKTTFTVKRTRIPDIYLLDHKDIVYFQSQGDFVLAFDQYGKKHPLNYTLYALINAMNPKLFFRINRKEIVHFPFIERFEPYIKKRLAIHLKTTDVVLYTANSRSAAFKEWIEEH